MLLSLNVTPSSYLQPLKMSFLNFYLYYINFSFMDIEFIYFVPYNFHVFCHLYFLLPSLLCFLVDYSFTFWFGFIFIRALPPPTPPCHATSFSYVLPFLPLMPSTSFQSSSSLHKDKNSEISLLDFLILIS